MENYKKSVIRELDTCLPLPSFIQDDDGKSVTITVKTGTKMRNVLSFAFKKLERPEIKHIIWLAEAEAIGKAVSCAEIMKRGQLVEPEEELAQTTSCKSGGKRKKSDSAAGAKQAHNSSGVCLYQTNVLGYRRTEEIWEPVVQGLDKLKVNKDVPILAVILSKEALVSTEFPKNAQSVTAVQQQQVQTDGFDAFWQNRVAAVLNNLPSASRTSVPIDIKRKQSSGAAGAHSSGRTPPVS